MILSKYNWKVKLFLICRSCWSEFTESYENVTDLSQTNLCTFIRTIAVWTPMMILAHLGLLLAGLSATIFVPAYAFGLTGYAWTVGGLISAAALIFGLKLIGTAIFENRLVKASMQKSSRPPTPKEPGMFSLIWQYLVAGKKKICPTITLKDY